MGDLGLEVRWQIDDVDGVERAFLRTDTASNAQTLGDEGDLGFGSNFNAQFTRAHDWAGFLAFLTAFLRLTFVVVDDGDSDETSATTIIERRVSCNGSDNGPRQFVRHLDGLWQ